MRSRHKSRLLIMKPTEEIGDDDMTFDAYQNVWHSPEDDGLRNLPSSVIEEPTFASMDFSPVMYPDFSMDRANQNPYSVDCTSVMHDSRWICSTASDSRDVIQSGLCNTDRTGLAGDPDSSILTSFACGDSTPAAVPLPMFEWSLAPESLSLLSLGSLTSPTITTGSADQAKPYPCPSCPNMSFRYNKDLTRHTSTVHPTGYEPVYRCRCGKSDFRKDNHLRHVGTCARSRSGIHYYACRCRSTYKEKDEYIDHVQSRHVKFDG
ncbi:hypothetical protein F4823DRAFT_548282 [Ustulina deusta]|nr:hypothetical protein F4823DRAFT_548282 [Ustulina deusta]